MIRSATVLFFLSSAPAFAAPYYVSEQGLDSNAGTAAKPWRTLQHAADAVGPGDVVHVADGVYAGFYPAQDGTAAAPITFKAQGTAAVIDNPSGSSGSNNVRLRSHTIIDGFAITGSPGNGVRFSGTTGAVIRNCEVRGNSAVNVYGGHATGTLIEECNIHHANTSHGIYVANSSTGVIIRRNQIHHNATAGIHLNGDLSQPPGDGVIRGLTIERNTIHDNGQNGVNMDGVQETTIRNNLIYANASNGIRAYVIDGGAGPKDLRIINNTILVPASGFWCVRITEDLGGNLARNNILLNDNPQSGSIALDSTNGFAGDHNLVVDRFTLDRGDTVIGLAGWQAQGYGTASALSSAAALFVDPASDKHLKPGCPAVDKGSATDAPADDLDGVARPQGGGFDIGCYELATTPPADGSIQEDGAPPTDAAALDGGSTSDGSPAVDSAPSGDGSPDELEDDGCGCAAGALDGPTGLCALLLLWALRARSRRRTKRGEP